MERYTGASNSNCTRSSTRAYLQDVLEGREGRRATVQPRITRAPGQPRQERPPKLKRQVSVLHLPDSGRCCCAGPAPAASVLTPLLAAGPLLSETRRFELREVEGEVANGQVSRCPPRAVVVAVGAAAVAAATATTAAPVAAAVGTTAAAAAAAAVVGPDGAQHLRGDLPRIRDGYLRKGPLLRRPTRDDERGGQGSLDERLRLSLVLATAKHGGTDLTRPTSRVLYQRDTAKPRVSSCVLHDMVRCGFALPGV